ncbi:MAG TPA: hypothetical protein VL173_15610 [Vicinamibacterales bacterium]|jgi:hypothetical protein|nr:hypothetical protein [Vicinamibacterales bacterium]
MTRLFLAWLTLSTLVGSIAAAQDVARKATISEPVLAGGSSLAPGTYEIRVGLPIEGAAQRSVEFVKDGMVVAREIAEVLPAAGSVGTSGAASRVRVERLKEGDYVRVSFVDGADRLLIYLPTRK